MSKLESLRAHPRAVDAVALAIVAMAVVWRGWAEYGGWFFGDDLIFLTRLAQGVDAAWFFERHNFHFMPIGLGLAWLVDLAGPFAWWAAATEMTVLYALACLLCWTMLRTAFGARWWAIPGLVFYCFTVVGVPANLWWASGLTAAPAQVGILTAIIGHLGYLRTTRRRWLLLVLLGMGIGLLSYVKALFVPMALGLLTLAYFADGDLKDRLVTVVRRYWPLWTLYVAVCAAYLARYVATSTGGEGGSGISDVDFGDAADHLIVDGLLTSIVGGPWRWVWIGPSVGPRLLADPPMIAVTLSVVALVAVLTLARIRRTDALLSLWFLVPYVVATYLTIALGRAATFGMGATADIRYWYDLMPYAALAIGTLVMPIRGAVNRPRPRADAPEAWPTRPTLVAVSITFVAGALVSTHSYVTPWHGPFDTRRFMENATAQLETAPAPPQIVDQPVAEKVIHALGGSNLPSDLLAPVADRFTTPTAGTQLQVFDDDGVLHPARVAPDASAPEESLERCAEGTKPATQRFDLGMTTIDYPFWISVEYIADVTTSAYVRAGEELHDVTLPAGRHVLSFTSTGAFDHVQLIPQDGRVCLEWLDVGRVMIPR